MSTHARICPRCGTHDVELGMPYTRTAAGVSQLFRVVYCRGGCLLKNGPSKKVHSRTRKEFRFQYAIESVAIS